MSRTAFSHWPPRVGDAVWMESREQHHGEISIVSWPDQECVIHFKGRKIVRLFSSYQVGRLMTHHLSGIQIDGILYPPTIELLCPDMLVMDGGHDSISFDDLRGNWHSTEDDGGGRWHLP